MSGGCQNTASGHYSAVSGGNANTASGKYSSVSGGGNNTASGKYSTVSGGGNNTAVTVAQNVCGKYNRLSTYVGTIASNLGDGFMVGRGTATNARNNAFRVSFDGHSYTQNAFIAGETNVAFYAKWADGNTAEEDRVGYFVTDAPDMTINISDGNDWIYGVVTGNQGIIGNGDEGNPAQFLRDEFGRPMVTNNKFVVNPECIVHRAQKRPRLGSRGHPWNGSCARRRQLYPAKFLQTK